MNIVKEQAGDLSAQIRISIVEEDYKPLVKKELNKIRNQAQMPGFRKGHAPQSIIQKLYGQAVMVEEVNKLLQESVAKFLEDEKLDILGHPFPAENTPPIDFDNDVEFEFLIDIALTPKVDIGFLKEMPATYYKIKSTEKALDDQIEDIRQQFGQMEEIKEPIQEKDYVRCDYQSVDNPDVFGPTFFFIDEKIHPGSQKFIGHKFGDTVEIDVEKEAGDDPSKAGNLLNLPIEELDKAKGVFKFTIGKVERKEKAPVDEALFEKAFPGKGIKTEEEFRAAIDEVHARISAEQIDRWFFENMFEQIIDKAHLLYDDDVLRRYVNHQKRVEHDKNHHHNEEGDCEACREITDEEFENIKKGTSWELIQTKIVEEYGINVDKADLRQAVKENICQYFGVDPNLPDEQLGYVSNIVDNYMQDEKALREYFSKALDKKITQALKEAVQLTTKEATWDEFKELEIDKKEPAKKSAKPKKTADDKKSEEKPKAAKKSKKADDETPSEKE